MGLLVNLTTGQRVVLTAHQVIGRSRRTDLRIDHGQVSGEHASIRWTDDGWQLVDLGSRNGTFHDDRRIDPGERVALAVGALLGFGGSEEAWRLDDDAPPGARAEATDSGAIVNAIDHLLALPSEAEPRALIYRADGRWIAEQDGESAPVVDGRELKVAGKRWRLRLPEAIPLTEAAPASLDVRAMRLRFAISRDEEHVHVVAACGEAQLDLKAHAHHYTLLTLARLRQRDAADPELPASSQGWTHIDDLQQMLRLDENQINVHIYRARRQLARLGVANAALVVERRSYHRQLRLGVDRFDIATA
ncbi:MAG: FHA domain-containing protein [Kofleriaceae bacterium]